MNRISRMWKDQGLEGQGWYAEDYFLRPNGFSPPLIYCFSKNHLSYTLLHFFPFLTGGEPPVSPFCLTQCNSSTLACIQGSCCPTLFSAPNFGPLATYCVHTLDPSAIGPLYLNFVTSLAVLILPPLSPPLPLQTTAPSSSR